MAAAIPASGRTRIRNSLKALVTHVGVTEDGTAFSDAQTTLDPAGDVPASRRIEPATRVDVDGDTFDATIEIDGGAGEFVGKFIRAIGGLSGPNRGDLVSRNVRTAAIGVEDLDVFTIGVRYRVSDVS